MFNRYLCHHLFGGINLVDQQREENNSFECMYIPSEKEHHLRDSLSRDENIQHGKTPPAPLGSLIPDSQAPLEEQ